MSILSIYVCAERTGPHRPTPLAPPRVRQKNQIRTKSRNNFSVRIRCFHHQFGSRLAWLRVEAEPSRLWRGQGQTDETNDVSPSTANTTPSSSEKPLSYGAGSVDSRSHACLSPRQQQHTGGAYAKIQPQTIALIQVTQRSSVGL